MVQEQVRYFLTVDWCAQGKRGVFCSRAGDPFSEDHPHTRDEMTEILGEFALILNPLSEPFTEAQLKAYSRFVPLAEYSNHFGIALLREEGEKCVPLSRESPALPVATLPTF
jgi:hypothetical protein